MSIYVQLGRYGDIIGFLPVLYHQYMVTGRRQNLMVSRDFADILEGVSYVKPVIFDGSRDELQRALFKAKAMGQVYGNVHNAQVSAPGMPLRKRTDCFMLDSWDMVGYANKWDQLGMVFDRRDEKREAQLAECVLGGSGVDTVLLNVNSSSSPFRSDDLQPAIDQLRSEYRIVDISNVKAHRLYDMLGLFDRCHALITVDTSVLHLAEASNIPVVALVNPKPWYGSAQRTNHLCRVGYNSIDPDAIVQLVRSMARGVRRYAHVYPSWDGMDPNTLQRHSTASESWKEVRKWKSYPVSPERTTAGMGDPARLYYVKDIIAMGLAKVSNEHDAVVITNSDVGIVQTTGHYLNQLLNTGAVFSYRLNHDRIERPIISRHQNLKGEWDGGLDLFAFTKWFWDAHHHMFPDMVMGAPKWDLVYRDIIKRLGGMELHGCVWHQKHRSRWQDDPRSKSTAHNEAIWKVHRQRMDPARIFQAP